MLAAARAPEKSALPENYAWNWFRGCLGTRGAAMSSKRKKEKKKKQRLIEIAVEWIQIRNIRPLKFHETSSLSCWIPLSFEKQRRFNKKDRWRCNLRGITRNVCPPFVQFPAHHMRGNGSYVSAQGFKTSALDLPTPRPFNTCTLDISLKITPGTKCASETTDSSVTYSWMTAYICWVKGFSPLVERLVGRYWSARSPFNRKT